MTKVKIGKHEQCGVTLVKLPWLFMSKTIFKQCAAMRDFSATDELLVIHQRLTTEFDDDFLALQQDDGCCQRSRTFYRPTRPAPPRSVQPYCRRLALSAHYDSAIRRAVAVLCSQRTSDEINEAI